MLRNFSFLILILITNKIIGSAERSNLMILNTQSECEKPLNLDNLKFILINRLNTDCKVKKRGMAL
jgi:hypothetical protein